MPTARGALTANFVNGSLFVIEGANNNPHSLETNEVYYPSNNTWKERAPMPTARGHLASAIVDGKLYALGGRLTDPPTNLMSQRSEIAAVAAAVNKTIYVFGGEAADTAFGPNERYDVVHDRWASDVPMPTPRHGLAAAAATVINNPDSNNNGNSNVIYVIGGADWSIHSTCKFMKCCTHIA